MKPNVYMLFLFLCAVHVVFSQKELDTILQLDLYKIALINQTDSYITFPTDGMDYYNIYFEHQLSIIRFGIMTEILRF